MRAARRPPDLSAAVVERAALAYLERFSASREQLRRVLARRILRAGRFGEVDRAAAEAAIAAVLDRLVARGLLDDARFAAGRALSLGRAGRSRRAIADRLRAKGVGTGEIDAALERLAEESPGGDLAAAAALARKRRLGPWRPKPQRAERRTRDLAALARAGFAYDVAKRVVDAQSPEAVEAMLGED